MKKNISICAMALLLLSSCSKSLYYQVYEVQSQDVTLQNNLLTYENDECVVKYNLWSLGGNLSFLFTNKTDKNLFIVMPKSFFILNGVANDYYSESSYTRAVTNTAQLAASRSVCRCFVLVVEGRKVGNAESGHLIVLRREADIITLF